jgi:hypothetical protein
MRIYRVLGSRWVATAIAIVGLFLVLWHSPLWQTRISVGAMTLGLFEGVLWFEPNGSPTGSGLSLHVERWEEYNGYDGILQGPLLPHVDNGIVNVPILLPTIFMCCWAAFLHGRARRVTPGTCRRCGYDLRGGGHSACPECGAA